MDGKKASLTATIRNESAATARKAFVAYTSFSRQLGEGEENRDKRFSDLRVSLHGRPINGSQEIADLLAMPGTEDIDLEIPNLRDAARPADLS